jgi:hypothetical protein
MAFIVAMVSQKSGVGKSTPARLLVCEFAAHAGTSRLVIWTSQATSFQWRTRRLQNKIERNVPVEQFGSGLYGGVGQWRGPRREASALIWHTQPFGRGSAFHGPLHIGPC